MLKLNSFEVRHLNRAKVALYLVMEMICQTKDKRLKRLFFSLIVRKMTSGARSVEQLGVFFSILDGMNFPSYRFSEQRPLDPEYSEFTITAAHDGTVTMTLIL